MFTHRKNIVGVGYGAEMYHEVQRLIREWHGLDASTQTSLLPQLVEDILTLARRYDEGFTQLAAHDAGEAA